MRNSIRTSTAILITLAVLALASAACSLSANGLKSGNATITVTLKENDINTLLENSTNNIKDEDVLLREITQVDMNDGSIRVFGTYQRADGSEANGSYDLVVAAEDGELNAQITGVDIEGVALGDRRISRINEELEESLARSARDNRDNVQFESVNITDESMTIRVKTHWDNK